MMIIHVVLHVHGLFACHFHDHDLVDLRLDLAVVDVPVLVGVILVVVLELCPSYVFPVEVRVDAPETNLASPSFMLAVLVRYLMFVTGISGVSLPLAVHGVLHFVVVFGLHRCRS